MSDATRILQSPLQSIAELYRRVRDLELRQIRSRGGYSYGGTVTITTTTNNYDLVSLYPGLRAVKVRLCGGGGGGGGAASTAGGQSSVGHGAGAAAYAEKWIPVEDLTPGGEDITIGGGGSVSSGAAGAQGGQTSFGSHVSANGGNPGDTIAAGAGPNSDNNNGANQTTTAGADLAIPGEHGGIGLLTSGPAGSVSGGGGSGTLGAGGRPRGSNSDGSPGAGYGAGGSGAKNGASQSARPGGVGAPGVCLIDLYY